MVNEEELPDEEKKAVNARVRNEAKEMCEKAAVREREELIGKESNDSLPIEVVEKDVEILKLIVKDIEHLADRYIAHIDRKRGPSKVSLNKIDKAFLEIEKIYKKYSKILTGSCSVTLEKTYLFNINEFFDEFKKWLDEKFVY